MQTALNPLSGIVFPVTNEAMRRALPRHENLCPECGAEVDTGWECNGCGFDAAPEANACTDVDTLRWQEWKRTTSKGDSNG